MRIDFGQQMRTDQRMKLAPRMIQSMEILQMAQLALDERIEQELSSNPTLEVRENTPDEDELREERTQQERDANEGERELVIDKQGEDNASNADDFERLDNISSEYGESWESNTFESGESYRRTYDAGERDAKMDAMANTAARALSLADQLLAQWSMVEAAPDVTAAGEFLIGWIDGDGYLRVDLDELQKQAPRGVTQQAMTEALESIRSNLEPAGLGAANLQDCLLLQIQAKLRQLAQDADESQGEIDPAAAMRMLRIEHLLVSEHLKDIGNNRLPQIAKATGYTLDEIKEAVEGLRQFYLHPGRLLAEDDVHAITPDAIIEFDEAEDRYVAHLTSGRAPSLQVSRRYSRMATDKQLDRRTRDFIGNNLRSARWLVEAIVQRQNTLLRVINVVLDAQRDFFDQGAQALKPLPMTLVADQLGIHVATVSRAVADKYLQTPRGILPLRMFFSGGTETEEGESVSWTAVQAKLKQVVDEEDKAKPLNDDELVEKLKGLGIEIARRTVAKYRKQLDIPPARQRKQH